MWTVSKVLQRCVELHLRKKKRSESVFFVPLWRFCSLPLHKLCFVFNQYAERLLFLSLSIKQVKEVFPKGEFFYVSRGFACEWDTELLLVHPLPPTEALKMFGFFVCAGKSKKKQLFNVLSSAQSWNFTNVQPLFFFFFLLLNAWFVHSLMNFWLKKISC